MYELEVEDMGGISLPYGSQAANQAFTSSTAPSSSGTFGTPASSNAAGGGGTTPRPGSTPGHVPVQLPGPTGSSADTMSRPVGRAVLDAEKVEALLRRGAAALGLPVSGFASNTEGKLKQVECW